MDNSRSISCTSYNKKLYFPKLLPLADEYWEALSVRCFPGPPSPVVSLTVSSTLWFLVIEDCIMSLCLPCTAILRCLGWNPTVKLKSFCDVIGLISNKIVISVPPFTDPHFGFTV